MQNSIPLTNHSVFIHASPDLSRRGNPLPPPRLLRAISSASPWLFLNWKFLLLATLPQTLFQGNYVIIMRLAAVNYLDLGSVPVTDFLSCLLSFSTLDFRTVIEGDYHGLVGSGFA